MERVCLLLLLLPQQQLLVYSILCHIMREDSSFHMDMHSIRSHGEMGMSHRRRREEVYDEKDDDDDDGVVVPPPTTPG
jgi:hypothetical protein